MKLLSFNIEISDVFELKEREDMENYAPFHVAVATTYIHNEESWTWHSEEEGKIALNLTPQRAQQVLEYLDTKREEGYLLCSWNGLGYGLKWLGQQAGNRALAAQLALELHDPMFQVFNTMGYPVALEKVAEGMALQQIKLMQGAEAPKEWRAGNHQVVINNCIATCDLTQQVMMAILETRKIKWRTEKGQIKFTPISDLNTGREVILEPEYVPHWMTDPIPKTRFCGWITEAIGNITELKQQTV